MTPEQAALQPLLTSDERARGVRAFHELSHARQAAVKPVLRPEAPKRKATA